MRLASSILVVALFLAPLGISLAASMAAAQGVVDAPMTPIQLSIAAGYSQIFKDEVPVYGLRTSFLWGEQNEVNGIDVGIFHTAVKTNGLALGIYNGLSESGTGIQMGLGSYVQQGFSGLQWGLANAVTGELKGAQLGIANQAGSGTGFQFGGLNVTDSMQGIQIGLWNVNPNGFLPYFPIINFSFGSPPATSEE